MNKEDIEKIKEFVLKNGESDGIGTLVYLTKKCEDGFDCINVNVLENEPFAFISDENDMNQMYVPIGMVFKDFDDFMNALNQKPETEYSLFDELLKHLGLYDEWVKQGCKGTICGKTENGDRFIFCNTEEHPYTLRAYNDFKTHKKVDIDFDLVWDRYMSIGGEEAVKTKIKELFNWRDNVGTDIPLSIELIFDAVKPSEEQVFTSVKRKKLSKEKLKRHENACIRSQKLVKDFMLFLSGMER